MPAVITLPLHFSNSEIEEANAIPMLSANEFKELASACITTLAVFITQSFEFSITMSIAACSITGKDEKSNAAYFTSGFVVRILVRVKNCNVMASAPLLMPASHLSERLVV